ncbi:MAG: hypothetical protein PVF05_10835 [Gemmatimonadales bacterium]|jgi:hypothetical protein
MKTARWLVVGFGVLVVCIGAWVVFDPTRLPEYATRFVSPSGLWIAIALRLAVGVLLWITAAASRTPRTLRVLGGLFVASAVALAVLGLERLQGIVDWGTALDPAVLRGVGLFVALVGAFLVWSVSPRRSEA